MKKETVEVSRVKNWMVGLIEYESNDVSSKVMDKLIEWSNIKNNKYKKVYQHISRYVNENIDDSKSFPYFAGNPKECERVVYLDIYWQ